jgi:acyl-coenzyme A synthetase/AMP-(fatty) acid ligase/REP element-mobilizing transposase RayT
MHDINLLEDQPIAWTPTPEVIERAQLTQFMSQVGVSTWDELYEFSICDVEKFTEEVLKYLDIKFDPPYEKLLDTTDGFEFPTWFGRSGDTLVPTDTAAASGTASAANVGADKSVRAPSAGLNITEMCLDRWQTDGMKDQPAVIWEGEEGEIRTYSYRELLADVECCAAGLRQQGLGKGDAIGIHLPMMIETVVALLGIARIGAIAVPVFSGYGVDAIASRLKCVGSKALFTCDGFPRRGKVYNAFSVAVEANDACNFANTLFSVGRIETENQPGVSDGLAYSYDYLLNDGYDSPEELYLAEPTAAEDPLIILYTSGTTGKPKGIAHTHASFPIKAAQDMAFGTDVGQGTRISWYTDIGWMMGPWLIYGALINGATICIYDGAPDYPTPDRMWEFCAKHKVEVLGISPTLVRSLAASEERSADTPVRMDAASTSTSSVRKGWSRAGRLPHFDGEVTQFITFRLADSLPKPVLERLKLQLEHDKLSDDSEEYRQRVEDFLDSGTGDCILRDPVLARAVEETILREHGSSCDLKAWVIMPNHAHLLLRLLPEHEMSTFMKRVKGVSARKINEIRGTNGPVWQPDYFDRYIRDGRHYGSVLSYIERNPVIAKLCWAAEEYEFGSAFAARFEAAEKRGLADKSVRAPFERHDLSSLRAFASTGEPWNPAPWWWLFEKVGDSKLPIINYSGGTEIAGGILMGNPLLPIKPCSFPAPCPGMDVDILDEEGKSVEPGKVGELVIKQPWIGMARGFWQEKERYLETYWRRFKNIWVHGDWAMRDKDGHWFILGRSDDTLKVAGKRVGPAEVESLLVAHPLVTEAAVIGVPDEMKGTAMVAFCVLTGAQASLLASASSEAGKTPSSDDDAASKMLALQSELKALVSRDMGKPLAPSKIHFVSALPKTRNAKVMRRVIRAAYLGEDPGDLSALENLNAVEELAEIRLRSLP